MHQCMDGDGANVTFTFLQKTINQKCLAALLGIGSKRLRKGMNTAPDLRYGKNKGGSRESTYSADAFFTTMYEQLAETLPDRCVGSNNFWDSFWL